MRCHVVPRMRVNKATLSSLPYHHTIMSVDPSTLSLSSPSPSSSSLHDDMDPSHESGPSRKRPRTTASATTSEERKEARAHRNRIAAQNSRDKRKAHFSYLERRVAELEEENRRLRAGGLVPPPTIPLSTVLPLHDDRLRSERESQKERENEELKARIRTLEKGWEAVMTALAAQGLPTGASASTPAQSTPLPTSTTSTASNTITISPPTDTSSKSFPSPAPSHDSLPSPSQSSVFTPNESLSPAPSQIGTSEPQINDEPTRHLARVATIEPSQAPMSLQRVVSPSLPSPMPYIRALQLKQQQQQQPWMMTRRWKTSSVRFSRRRNQRTRHCCLLRILPQRK